MPTIKEAWLSALRGFFNPGSTQTGLLVRVDQFDDDGLPTQDIAFQIRLDEILRELNAPSIGTTARTIFPFSLAAVRNKESRQHLYERYEWIMPTLRQCPLNKNGIYFERMIMFPSYDTHPGSRINQLERILRFWDEDGRRKSAFQVCIYKPETAPSGDWTKQPYAQFPCMQHLTFAPNGKELHVSAFYATQYLIKRGYGNYLGLCRLGAFMAHEMGLRMTSMNCYASHAPLEKVVTKASLRGLIERLEHG